MPAFIADPEVEKRIRAERHAAGADKYDEVWDGVYVIMPLPDIEHQRLAVLLASCFVSTVDAAGLGQSFAGVNVSDRRRNWRQNYREPDVAVYLSGSSAENCGTHWLGGPNLAVEIVSPHDRSREKLEFYARVGVDELLLVDRDPWRLELYRRRGDDFEEVGVSTPDNPQPLKIETAPLTLRLLPGEPRPQIELAHEDGRRWLA
jgi:Uma2 family endonuclease